MQAPAAPILAALLSVAAYGATSPAPGSLVPESLVAAVIAVESAGDASAMRFEPHLVRRFGCSGADAECRALATSVGLMQVVPGFHLRRCSLSHWTELLSPNENIRCGKIVLEDCYLRSGRDWRKALKCYNGSDRYPPLVFAKLKESL